MAKHDDRKGMKLSMQVPLLGQKTKRWSCVVCGYQTGPMPGQAHIPHALIISTDDGYMTAHCPRCQANWFRKNIPQMQEVGEAPPSNVVALPAKEVMDGIPTLEA